MEGGNLENGDLSPHEGLWLREFYRENVRTGGLNLILQLRELSPERGNDLCQSPMAAITSYHKLSCFKPEKYILSQFRRLAVKNQGDIRATLPPRLQGRICSLPHPASGGFMCSLSCRHITPVSVSVVIFPSSLCIYLIRIHVNAIRSHLDNPR